MGNPSMLHQYQYIDRVSLGRVRHVSHSSSTAARLQLEAAKLRADVEELEARRRLNWGLYQGGKGLAVRRFPRKPKGPGERSIS